MISSGIDARAVHRARLSNGLTVLVYRNPAAPVVSINTYVKAGYFDETDDIVGIAHVLEHMFFKGTSRRGVGAIAKETKSVGGYLNAHTIYDHTSYYTVLPSSSLTDGLDIQADAYANSVIDAAELRKELEVIIQEAKRKDDYPGAVTTETLYELLYDRHRIRRWRIGREAELRALTSTQVLEFYRNFYTPSNTILVIAGDVDLDQTLAHVERLYGSLPGGEPVRSPGPNELEHEGARYRELHGDIAQTHLALGWRTVPTVHPDTPALDMVASVLSAGRASRLYRAVRERKLAGSVGAYQYSPVEVGMFIAYADAEPETARDATRAIWAQIESVRTGTVSNTELERVKQLFASRWIRRLETVEGQASYLAEWEALGDWTQGAAYYDAFLALQASDVQVVAQRYLTPNRVGTVVYRPNAAPEFASSPEALYTDLAAVRTEPLSELGAGSPTVLTAQGRAEFVREEYGVRVYETHTRVPILVCRRVGVPLTYLGVYAASGAINETVANAGITTLAARMTSKGTATRSAFQIAQESESLGGSIAASAGAESFGWSFSVPSANTTTALELLGDVVQHPTLAPEVLETERRALLSELAQMRDDMYRYPMRLLADAAFGTHPYGIPVSGTETSVEGLTADDIRTWYQEKMRRAPYVIAIVGDVDADHVAEQAARNFGELAMAERSSIVPPEWPDHIVERIEQREKSQTALALGFAAPARTDDTRFAAHVLATVASGLGGRFFDELRDKQSLAYTVHAFASEYRTAGTFVSYIATSPAQECVAREGLLGEFAKLRDTPITDEELRRAKRYMIGMHDIRQERGGAVLGDLIDAWLFGSGLKELHEFEAHVERVTGKDIQQLAQRYFNPDRRAEGIVRGT